MSHAAAGAIDPHHDPTTSTGIPNKKLFMWAFLASDCMFFGSLISTHMVYRLNPIPGNANAVDTFNIELTSFSTFILLMSSLMMALSVAAIQKNNIQSMRRCLLTTIFFGLIFLECQVYEFAHFVSAKGLTLSSSMFGSTFYVLTGTHGTHVAIGVFWLILMYVRSFQPLSRAQNPAWPVLNFAHIVVFLATVVLGMAATLAAVHVFERDGLTLAGFGHVFTEHYLLMGGTVAGIVALYFFGGSTRGRVDFNEANAIDVESMGLYWHFVDIVWIVIFTAVYLIEYVPKLTAAAS
jgi:cytochrome o ubiquinol oxidase subunit 3